MQILKYTRDPLPVHRSIYIAEPSSPWLPYYVDSLGINAQGSRYATERAEDDTLFLCLTLEGQGYMEYGDRVLHLVPGDLILIDCMDWHFYRTEGERWHFLWLHCRGNSCRPTFRNIEPSGIFYRHLDNTDYFHSLYDELRSLICLHTVEADISASERLSGLLMQIARYQYAPEKPTYPPPIERTLSYMELHYDQALTVCELAAMENYSINYFTRLFTSSVGTSPYRYLTTLRLRHAHDMLLNTAHSVEEIARLNNFSCCSRFIRLFSEQYGATPLQYRKRMEHIMGTMAI